MSKKLPDNRTLPSREAATFRSIVKQYRRALKSADQVLKKFPQHGETLAMRGLTLNALDKKEEAYDHVKRGLRNDLRSHVCWHVYGLLYRSDRNYAEAIKCYLNALKWDRDNLQILRDLSLLQVQMQDYDGFVETRRKILTLKSNNKMHWISYAVGNLLGGRCESAAHIVNTYLNTEVDTGEGGGPGYEDSELVLFRNQAIAESGKLDEALADLDAIKTKVLDMRAYLSMKGTYLLKLGRHGDAAAVYREALELNAENYDYHRGYQAALLTLEGDALADSLPGGALKFTALPSSELALDAAQVATLVEAYAKLTEAYPRSPAVKRIQLAFLPEAERQERLRAYIVNALRKGKPNLGTDLRTMLRVPHPTKLGFLALAKDPLDVATLPLTQFFLGVADECIASTRENGGALPAWAGAPPTGGESPSALLWAMFLKVQLLEAMGMLAEALALCEECITHTPTAIDLYMRKGRLLKKLGDTQEAAEVVDFARKIDLADRYINNKATKYLLRADRVEQAEGTIALFTRHEGDPQYNLFEMQCSWYELEWAESQQRQRKYGLALKKFFAVDKHFEDFMEDQFDFHTYCLRKGTLRAYVNLLRMASGVQSHEFFQRTAKGIITTYLALYDDPASMVAVEPKTNGAAENDDATAADTSDKPAKEEKPKQAAPPLTAAQKKRAKKAAKKKAKKGAAATEEKEAPEEKEEEKKEDNAGGRRRRQPPADDDPVGAKLAARDPLEEAAKFCKLLNLRAAGAIDTHVLSYDVCVRRGKPLMALRALVKGYEIAPKDAELFRRIVDFEDKVASGAMGLDETQAAVVESLAGRWRVEGGVLAFVRQFADAACGPQGTLRMRVEAAAALAGADPGSAAEAEALMREGLRSRGASITECRHALATLTGRMGQGGEQLAAALGEQFPRASF